MPPPWDENLRKAAEMLKDPDSGVPIKPANTEQRLSMALVYALIGVSETLAAWMNRPRYMR